MFYLGSLGGFIYISTITLNSDIIQWWFNSNDSLPINKSKYSMESGRSKGFDGCFLVRFACVRRCISTPLGMFACCFIDFPPPLGHWSLKSAWFWPSNKPFQTSNQLTRSQICPQDLKSSLQASYQFSGFHMLLNGNFFILIEISNLAIPHVIQWEFSIFCNSYPSN